MPQTIDLTVDSSSDDDHQPTSPVPSPSRQRKFPFPDLTNWTASDVPDEADWELDEGLNYVSSDNISSSGTSTSSSPEETRGRNRSNSLTLNSSYAPPSELTPLLKPFGLVDVETLDAKVTSGQCQFSSILPSLIDIYGKGKEEEAAAETTKKGKQKKGKRKSPPQPLTPTLSTSNSFSSLTASTLRQLAVSYIWSRPRRYRDFITMPAPLTRSEHKTVVNLETYCNKMWREKVDGDHITLQGLADCLGVRIGVVKKSRASYNLGSISSGGGNEAKKTTSTSTKKAGKGGKAKGGKGKNVKTAETGQSNGDNLYGAALTVRFVVPEERGGGQGKGRRSVASAGIDPEVIKELNGRTIWIGHVGEEAHFRYISKLEDENEGSVPTKKKRKNSTTATSLKSSKSSSSSSGDGRGGAGKRKSTTCSSSTTTTSSSTSSSTPCRKKSLTSSSSSETTPQPPPLARQFSHSSLTKSETSAKGKRQGHGFQSVSSPTNPTSHSSSSSTSSSKSKRKSSFGGSPGIISRRRKRGG